MSKHAKNEDPARKPKWKKMLDAALADVKAGRGTFYENEEDFMAALASNFRQKKNIKRESES